MGKKYIVKNGKKIYLDEGSIKEEADDADPDDDADKDPADPADPADDDADVDAAAEKIAKRIMGKIKMDDVSELSKKVDQLIKAGAPVDSKLKDILNGKDYIRDREALTKEEVIVGFYHALITGNERAVKALSEGTAADGGNLLPADFWMELNRDLVDLVVMRQIARTITMRRNTLPIPRVTSSVQVYWTAENASKTTTTASFTQDTLTARKLAAILYASDELIEDSTGMGSFDIVQLIITLFAEAIASQEEFAFMQGNGTTQPTGLETARTAGTIAAIAAANQNFDDVIRLEYSLKPQYRANAVFLANDQTFKELRILKDGQNRYLWQEPLAAGQPATFHGYRCYSTMQLPKGVIYFGDFKKGYWIGDRKQVTVKVTQDSETAFTKDQTAIRVVERVAGNVVLPSAIKALTGM